MQAIAININIEYLEGVKYIVMYFNTYNFTWSYYVPIVYHKQIKSISVFHIWNKNKIRRSAQKDRNFADDIFKCIFLK